MGLAAPESNVPTSLVTVRGATVMLVHVTVVPTGMVSVAGPKAKLPLLFVVIVTHIVRLILAVLERGVITPPLAYPPYPPVLGVGVGIRGVVVLGVVEVSVGLAVNPVLLLLLPHAASTSMIPSVSRKNQLRVWYPAWNSLCICFFLFLGPNGV
jgi:hypothetical protein